MCLRNGSRWSECIIQRIYVPWSYVIFLEKEQPVVLYSFWKLPLSTNNIHYKQLLSAWKENGNTDYLKTNKQKLQSPAWGILLFLRGKMPRWWSYTFQPMAPESVDKQNCQCWHNGDDDALSHFPENNSFSVCAWLCDPNAGDMGKTTA